MIGYLLIRIFECGIQKYRTNHKLEDILVNKCVVLLYEFQ